MEGKGIAGNFRTEQLFRECLETRILGKWILRQAAQSKSQTKDQTQGDNFFQDLHTNLRGCFYYLIGKEEGVCYHS